MRKTRVRALRRLLTGSTAFVTLRRLKKNWTRSRALMVVERQTENRRRGWLQEQDRLRRTAWQREQHAARVAESRRRVSLGGGGL